VSEPDALHRTSSHDESSVRRDVPRNLKLWAISFDIDSFAIADRGEGYRAELGHKREAFAHLFWCE
jgi:hypothetical protein